MTKIKIVIPQVTYDVDTALVDGLRYMGTLNELDLNSVNPQFHEQFRKLFDYAKIRMEEGGRDRHLPDLVRQILVNEPDAPTWVSDTDARHTVASFGNLSEICNGESYHPNDQKRLLTAMVVHDCAYPKTQDFAAFTSSDTRLVHMQEAEREFRDFAGWINRDYPGFYSAEDIDEICSIVRQHDNPGVKKDRKVLQFSYNPPKRELVWAHREADRLWMLDKAGFALDLLRRLVESNPWYDPAKYLDHVVSTHLKEAEKYQDADSCIVHNGKKSMYRTPTGFNIFTRLIRDRTAEYQIAK